VMLCASSWASTTRTGALSAPTLCTGGACWIRSSTMSLGWSGLHP
jgi:hypothetical protein